MKINIKIVGTQIDKNPPFEEISVEIDKEVTLAVGEGVRFNRVEMRTQAMGKIIALHPDQNAVQVVTETGVEFIAPSQIVEVYGATEYDDALNFASGDLQHYDRVDKHLKGGD